MSQESFAALGVSAKLIAALEAHGISVPFQIQTRAIPPALAGTDLLAKLQDLEADTQASLLRFATRGDFTTPSCPSCGIKMVRKTPKGGGDVFWGCPNFPRCRTTLAAGK